MKLAILVILLSCFGMANGASSTPQTDSIEAIQKKLREKLFSESISKEDLSNYISFEGVSAEVKKITEQTAFIDLDDEQINPVCTMVYKNPNVNNGDPYRYVVFQNDKRHFTLEERMILNLDLIDAPEGRKNKFLGKDGLISLPLNELARSYGEVYVLKVTSDEAGVCYRLVENMIPKFDFSLFYKSANLENKILPKELAPLKVKVIKAIEGGEDYLSYVRVNLSGIQDVVPIVVMVESGKLYVGTEKQFMRVNPNSSKFHSYSALRNPTA